MRDTNLAVTYVPTADLVPYARNAKTHDAKQVAEIAKSIEEFGFDDPVGVWTNRDGLPEIVEGHGRVLAAKRLGMETVPVLYLDHLSDEERRAYTHIHNQTTLSSGFDMDVLAEDMADLDVDWAAYGFDIAEGGDGDAEEETVHDTIMQRFAFVPFSVVNSTAADWRDRTAEWNQLGIDSALGRGDELVYRIGIKK